MNSSLRTVDGLGICPFSKLPAADLRFAHQPFFAPTLFRKRNRELALLRLQRFNGWLGFLLLDPGLIAQEGIPIQVNHAYFVQQLLLQIARLGFNPETSGWIHWTI